VYIGGITPNPDQRWMTQIVRNITDIDDGVMLCVGGGRKMATNLAIDPRLLEDAQKAGNLKTKKETVNEALREFIQRRKQAEMLKLFGTVDFD
jgi:Arc/MetJ family transcription regulator